MKFTCENNKNQQILIFSINILTFFGNPLIKFLKKIAKLLIIIVQMKKKSLIERGTIYFVANDPQKNLLTSFKKFPPIFRKSTKPRKMKNTFLLFKINITKEYSYTKTKKVI